MRVTEREITAPVSLTTPDGRLNPAAVGWTRTPLLRTDGIGRGRYAWGRNKRWEYWAVTTPSHIVAFTVADIDYAALHELWVFDRATGTETARSALGVLGGSAQLPGTLGAGPVRGRKGDLAIAVDEADGGTRLRVVAPGVRVDVVAERPPGHECLGVVVPWSERLFQYTVKDVARPARGALWLDGRRVEVPAGESWAVLDHGRGRWPYDIAWNWGAGSGISDGRVIGVQVGGQWTDGTGSVENALVVDGRLHKISEELAWEYDSRDYLKPWRVRGETVDLAFEPFHDRRARTELGVITAHTDQCFGHWSGWMADSAGERVEFAGILGWAEDVHNRW